MINATKIVLGVQTYYTPTWSGVASVKILKYVPDSKVLVKVDKNTFIRPLKHMYNTDKAARIGKNDWERDERKRKKNKKESVPP